MSDSTDRRSVRGISQDVWDRAVKGAELADKSVGAWISEKLVAGFEADRVQSRSLAPVPPTALKPRETASLPREPELDVTYHLAVLEGVARFASADMPDSVRQQANRVICDRLKALRLVKPRQTKSQKSLTNGADLSDGDA